MEAIAIIENIVEHAAATLGKDPMDVRMVNLAPDGGPLVDGPNVFQTSIYPLLQEKGMLADRKAEIKLFNQVRECWDVNKRI